MLRLLFLALKAEIKRWIILVKRYPVSFISSAGALYIIFMGMFFGSGSARTVGPQVMGDTLVGYLMWIFVFSAIGDLSDTIISESLTGTYEHLCITRVSNIWILICRAITQMLSSFLLISFNLILITITTGIKLNIEFFPVVVILGLSLLGLYGFGFMLAALALIFKRIGPIASVLQYVLLFITGAIIPLNKFPPIIRLIGQSLPLSAGIEAMQMSAIDHHPLQYVVQEPVFTRLLFGAVIYVLLGIIAFISSDGYARKKGLLGQY
jgi:ABC-2 type transport system permease protein